MSTQSDWVGNTPPDAVRQFKDIRNTRDSVAAEKARLSLELHQLMKKPPAKVVNGSVQVVRRWQAAREAARKVAGSARSSTQDLRSAINSMRGFES